MILGAAFVLAALSLFLWNGYEDRKAGSTVEKILPMVIEETEAAVTDSGADSAYPDSYSAEMTEREIDGYSYIGYLSIPSLALELPVMSEWDYVRMKIAPCRYYGSTKTDDLVIAAHNYSRHFGTIKNLSIGDMVIFTDMDGKVSVYEVAELDILSPAAVDEMTDSGYDLTLFTCTYGGKSRVTVRCDRAE